jgi:hypothetical protein
MSVLGKRRAGALVAAEALVIGIGVAATDHDALEAFGLAKEPGAGLPHQPREMLEAMMGESGEAGEEAFEASTAAGQFAEARVAPGVVAPGAYGAAFTQLTGMSASAGRWSEVTGVPYDSDDPRYRDYASNSSGGAGKVTGRITGIAADDQGDVYAAGANGGVWRSTTGGGQWTPIADKLPSLSSGDLALAGDGSLWYATGEANTGSTAFVGSGVYRLADPRTGSFDAGMRVGGDELESTVIQKLRFAGGKVWAATSRGLYTHSASTTSGSWHLEYVPNPDYLPRGPKASDPQAAYKNIVNDVAVDPRNPKHVVAAVGWRGGDTYNGFYETADYTAGGWHKVNPTGAIQPDDIGFATFAFAADGSKLYVINQSPRLYNKTVGTVNSYLDGIYVSGNGSPSGPWNKIADSTKWATSGSALKQATGGKGYGPGIQSWYNQFLAVDPHDANHVYAGLEEVAETTNGGSTWHVVGPYWNFNFSCWSADDSKNTCQKTTHSDQHSVAIGTVQGKPYVFVGNDGGIYRRPVNGSIDGAGHATDWQSLNDGTIDALQYYSVSVGKDTYNGNTGVGVSGGLQDNGASMLRPGDTTMGSPFGGDGGDSLADPNNACRQVQEYVYLAMSATNNCNANTDPSASASTSRNIQPYLSSPGDEPARFIAPFGADAKDVNHWIAGGQHVWLNDKGFGIAGGKDWKNAFDLGSGRTATAVALSQGVAYVGWCGPCNNSGFARGIAVGKFGDPASFHQVNLPVDGAVPNRYVAGFGVDPADPNHAFVAINGFSRRWTEGPGAGVGHVFETTDMGATWKDVSGNLPDVPANAVKVLPNGGLVLATDLATLYRAPGATTWQRMGTGLPTTAAMDVEYSAADQSVYVATHGRGIWRFALSQLG